MSSLRAACLIAAFLISVLCAHATFAALAPSTIKRMKAEATDVVELKITKVVEKGRSGERLRLLYTATVTKVDRSKSGLKVGDSIEIDSYRVVSLIPLPGPKSPPLLKAGWVGTIYLNASKEGGPYKLAVFGHSFVAKGGA